MEWIVSCWCGDGGVEVVFNEEVVESMLWCETQYNVYIPDDGDFSGGVCDLYCGYGCLEILYELVEVGFEFAWAVVDGDDGMGWVVELFI